MLVMMDGLLTEGGGRCSGLYRIVLRLLKAIAALRVVVVRSRRNRSCLTS